MFYALIGLVVIAASVVFALFLRLPRSKSTSPKNPTWEFTCRLKSGGDNRVRYRFNIAVSGMIYADAEHASQKLLDQFIADRKDEFKNAPEVKWGKGRSIEPRRVSDESTVVRELLAEIRSKQCTSAVRFERTDDSHSS